MKLDDAIGIAVCNLHNLLTDAHVHAQLFIDLAPQTRIVCFTRLALAAGELPASFEVHARGPARDEIRAIPLNHCGGDDNAFGCRRGHASARSFSGLNGYAAQFVRMGQTRHFGFRATHIVAPKSMSA